ncbi:MAG TPA: dienelactone hydrolase family protein [Blastocatellia bacterium]|nr:dienelactone hydrolase family protein [Blastocatellia bacterium]
MIINTEYVDLTVDESPMRLLVAAPKQDGRYPGIIFYSDIFQLTGPMIRATARLAGYGFVVAAPEIYHRIEPPSMAIPFDDAGRDRGLANAAKTSVAEFDADCRATLDYLKNHSQVAERKVGAGGFCIGGHLAFRAALQPDVKATVCFYGTGIHNGKLGKDADAGSLARASDIRGELLMIFGSADPHVPEAARAKIKDGLESAGAKFSISLYDAEHAFMRDEGPRFDPVATDQAWNEMIEFYGRHFERV